MLYGPRRWVSKEALARRFGCELVENAVDIIITGSAGSGKSRLGYAITKAACRYCKTTHYVRMPVVIDELRSAREADHYDRLMAKYKKHELFVMDEFVLSTTTEEETRDLYELVEGRSQVHSTVFCSQYQEAGWLERLGSGTSAEGIVDRIRNNSYRIELAGELSMREKTSKVDNR